MVDERGVSEVVGFVLVFSLVLGTITFVYVGGFGGLQDTRDHEQMANAERAFDVLANNLEELGQGKAPSRATEIKLAGAQIRTTEPSLMTVNSTGMNASGASPRSIVYRPQGSDSAVIYEAGAVIRADGEQATMIREPDFVFGPNRTVIRVIETRGGLQSTSGDTTTLIRAEGRFQEVRHSHQDSDVQFEMNVSIRPASGHVEPWHDYLEEALNKAYGTEGVNYCTAGSTKVSCPSLDTHSVYFASTGVQVEIV